MDKLQQTFLEEARELLADLEDALLALEHEPNNYELIGKIFRAMHTIKGSSAMFGFDNIASFTHQIETVLDLVRDGKMAVSPELISLTLACRDHITLLLQAAENNIAPDATMMAQGQGIIDSLQKLMPASIHSQVIVVQKNHEPAAQLLHADVKNVFWIHFKPPQNIYLIGSDPINLLDELRTLGVCDIVASTKGIPPLSELQPECCYLTWDILLTTDRTEQAIKDVFIFVEDDSEIQIKLLAEEAHIGKTEYESILAALASGKNLSVQALRSLCEKHKSNGIKPDEFQQVHSKAATSIKVPSEKLDKLVNLVGELVTVQARLSQLASHSSDSNMLSVAEDVEELTWELRDNMMSIRMLPIGTTFGRFRRLVRDLSAELGKEIELVTEGEETELDKTVIERLSDPMVHMIRNCIDHGIESPAERKVKGKPPIGTIRLSAVHSGANVLIRIADDGKGLDTEAIRAKAVANGLIAADAQTSEQELFALIFAAGFSTAKQVSNVSGRGVGMDVVKRSIEELRGTIILHSKKDVGTTVTLKLPLTLAIIEGLLVKVGQDQYVLPLAIVKECAELPKTEQLAGNGGQILNVRGDTVPFIKLRDYFQIHTQQPNHEYVVITELDDARIGFVVDEVLGEHQTVIKALGAMYKNVEGVSGATVLGDGTVALIIDIPKVVTVIERTTHPCTA